MGEVSEVLWETGAAGLPAAPGCAGVVYLIVSASWDWRTAISLSWMALGVCERRSSWTEIFTGDFVLFC